MARYFIELSYHGSAFAGWQRQPGQETVQGALEHVLSAKLRRPIEVTGCGRTDTGVHATQYYCHFDTETALSPEFMWEANNFLPAGIALKRIFPVHPEAHARFDAVRRAYTYHLHTQKNPFQGGASFYFAAARDLTPADLQPAAELLLGYDHFFPFCKSDHDAQTLRCELMGSEWLYLGDGNWEYHIAANRFLRGMVRLIVGMCLNVALGKLPLEAVRHALDTQQRLPRDWSVPPEGLFLSEVRYDFVD